jgi:hypothetical protein
MGIFCEAVLKTISNLPPLYPIIDLLSSKTDSTFLSPPIIEHRSIVVQLLKQQYLLIAQFGKSLPPHHLILNNKARPSVKVKLVKI